MSARVLQVLATGALTTVQDLGRPGFAAIGIGASGAADRRSCALANRLVGNQREAAALELTFGGLSVQASGIVLLAVTGAPCTLTTNRPAGAGMNAPFYLRDGEQLVIGAPSTGLRTYLAVRGGVDVPSVLGSRSTDLLAGLGPDPLAPGDELRVGEQKAAAPGVDLAPVPDPPGEVVDLSVVPGPRDDWFVPEALAALTAEPYAVSSDSNRIGMRLEGRELVRRRTDELPSEGMVPGALQVPPNGRPTVFLADHPVTGGYPVIAVVVRPDVDRAAQARPGQPVHFHLVNRRP